MKSQTHIIALPVACGGLFAGMISQVAQAERIRLATGEVLNAQVLETTPTTTRILHPVLGELTLPSASIAILPDDPLAVSPAPAEPVAGEQAPLGNQPPPAVAPPEPAPVPEPPPKEWKFKLVLAASLSEGNTQNANLSTIFTALRERPETKLAFDTALFYAENDGVRSENRFTIGGRHDWLNPGSKWFYFADARFDIDEFQSWDSRLSGHVGIGYKLIEPPKFMLNAIAGIGAVKEFGSDNDDVRPEALIGLEGKYDFAEKHSLTFSTVYYPDLSDIGEYRWVNMAGWSFLLDKETQLSLTAGVQHEYQSQIDPGRKYNDLRVFAGLQLDF